MNTPLPHRGFTLVAATFRPSRQPRRWLLACVVALAIPAPAVADAVTDWNEFTMSMLAPPPPAAPPVGGPPQQARVTAMVQLAVHDALNAIEPRFESYLKIGAFNPSASPQAAVARATRDVLIGVLPDAQDAIVGAQYGAYVGGLSCEPAHPGCIGDGEAAGAAAAAAMLQERHLDGSENPHRPYTLAPAPGVYQATLPLPPAGPAIQLGGWGEVKTFALGSSSQFLPGRAKMLDVTSAEYAAEYNEVKNLGSFAVRYAAPESEESRIARFWPGGGRDYNRITRTIVGADPTRDLWDNAHLFALVNMAVADASIATFNVKYHYNFWRPVTAIHWADDGNPATEPDATWTSYITTPPYPDYTCGLPTLIGASTGMLREYFGTDAVPFDHLGDGVTRHYETLSQASAEAASARVYGGIHFRTGCVRAVEQAEDVANFVFNTQLRPLRP